jgi:DNA-binding transcriptional MerR regulator
MSAPVWTLDELVAQVASALAVDYGGQASGRVRDLPDRRAVRWYQTLGLVDRPADWRGRTALYGRRHLLQLAAIKRLQAAGHTLAEIQAELAGMADERLARLAGVDGQQAAERAGERGDAVHGRPPEATRNAKAASARRFWAARANGPDRPEAGNARPSDEAGAGAAADAAQWRGIQLGPAAILLLHTGQVLDDDDLRELEAAAAPLLAALRDRAARPHARKD